MGREQSTKGKDGEKGTSAKKEKKKKQNKTEVAAQSRG